MKNKFIKINETDINHIKLDIKIKILAIMSFLCVIISLIIILITPSANIYEISIYNAYPWYFWFFIIISIFIGQLIIFKNFINNFSENKNKIWLLGLLAILIPIIILLTLHIIRGYPTYGLGDHLYHIGEIKDILRFGYIGQENFYPNLHILTGSLILVTNGGLIHNVNFILVFFFILSPISMYLFFRLIFDKKNKMKIALLFTSTFLFFVGNSIYLAPYHQSFLLIPIILYLYFKRSALKDTILFSLLLTIILISYTFYHPINMLLIIPVFLFFTIIFYLYNKFANRNFIEYPEKKLKETSLNIFFFSILLFSLWYFSFSSIIRYFHKIFLSILYGVGESLFESQSVLLSSYSPNMLDILKIIIYTYGVLILVGLLSIFSLLYILNIWYRNKSICKSKAYLSYSILSIMFFFGLIAGSIFSDFIVGWNRFMIWASIFTIILVSFTFHSLLSNIDYHNCSIKSFKKLGLKISIFIIFVSLTYLSVSTIYHSPLTGDTNSQVTKMSWLGVEWIYEYSNKNIRIDELGISQGRFYRAIYGLKNYPINYKIEQPPDHFGYTNKTFLGEYYENNRYILITHSAKILYPKSYPDYEELWRFTTQDFNQLQNDNTVIMFYNNGGFESYLIRSN